MKLHTLLLLQSIPEVISFCRSGALVIIQSNQANMLMALKRRDEKSIIFGKLHLVCLIASGGYPSDNC